ncbi:MAG: hypothetical protein KAK00_07830 [Nanoarchaeota archaeon]|nr:hypothetical protein [Nanoarchaeota archaeon]
MPKYLTQKEAFVKCKKEGKFIVIEEIDRDKIKSTLNIAEADTESANFLKKNLPKQSNQWNSVYKLYYDALHELAESFLRLEKIKIDNHQCLFAYLCEKHQELGFNWDFFEKVRTKRNGINYYGTPVSFDDWKEVELQFNLYIKKLKEEVRKMVYEYEQSFLEPELRLEYKNKPAKIMKSKHLSRIASEKGVINIKDICR